MYDRCCVISRVRPLRDQQVICPALATAWGCGTCHLHYGVQGPHRMITHRVRHLVT